MPNLVAHIGFGLDCVGLEEESLISNNLGSFLLGWSGLKLQDKKKHPFGKSSLCNDNSCIKVGIPNKDAMYSIGPLAKPPVPITVLGLNFIKIKKE